jgi:hypothetical protein
MSSCSLHEKKEMNEGMALMLNKLSDKSFVPDKKYVDQMKMKTFVGGEKESSTQKSPEIIQNAILVIISFTIYCVYLASVREITWVVATNYMTAFRDNIITHVFGGQSNPLDVLEFALGSIDAELNRVGHLCISQNDMSEYITKVSYETVYSAITSTNGVNGLNLCAQVFEYQMYKAKGIYFIKNMGVLLIALVSKGFTGKTMFGHIKEAIYNNRPDNLFSAGCVLDSVYEGKTDLYGNHYGGKKKTLRKSRRTRVKSSKSPHKRNKSSKRGKEKRRKKAKQSTKRKRSNKRN